MQQIVRDFALLLLSGLTLLSTGCGSSEPAASDADSAMIDELLNSSGELAEPAEPAAFQGDDSHSAHAVSRSKTGNARHPMGDRLELRLREGDRFPLIKTIEQSLRQKSETDQAFAITRLELTLTITVQQVAADAILMGVVYSRVNYQHDVAGQQLSFDSSNHRGAIPWDALPYAGMVGNGFSFWLGRDNSIREMVGYREFLERCVANVPLDRRETLLSEISNRFGDDGVANFVDDSIGMLPYDNTVDAESATRVMLGDMWTRERRLMQPVPVHLTTTYRLTSMNNTTAEIDITGRVATGEAATPDQAGRLRISGGHSLGRCVVDRATGLPLEMNLTRMITMKVTTSDLHEVTQEKQIITTIRAFPEARGPVATMPASGDIQRVSGTPPQNFSNSPTEPASNNTRAVRAVYPDEQ